jgi:predicted transcriptional regulator
MTALPKAAYQTFTVEVEDDVAERLERVAEEMGVPVEELIVSLAQDYAANGFQRYDDWSEDDVVAIERGIAQLKNGQKVHQDDMMARLKAKYAV